MTRWVEIEGVILEPGQRAPQVPEDTGSVPLEFRLKGFLDDEDAAAGDLVTITTVLGRKVTGTLARINPKYTHDFGEPVPELLTVGMELRQLLAGELPRFPAGEAGGEGDE